MVRCILVAAMFTVGCLGQASQAIAAPNLVVDGSFESDASGNYAASSYIFNLGPSTFGPNGVWHVNNGFVGIDSYTVQAHSGNNSLFLAPGNPNFPSDLTQTLSTIAGSQYVISFFAAAGGPNSFFLKFGGVPVAGAPASFPSTIPMFATDFSQDYLQYSFTVTALASSSVLELGGTSTSVIGLGPDTINIDDISVTQFATSVPEPASLALLTAGLIGFGARRHTRRNRGGELDLLLG